MNKNFRKFILTSLFLTACSSIQSSRQVIDSNSSSRPGWASGTQIGWQDGDFTLLRSQYGRAGLKIHNKRRYAGNRVQSFSAGV